MKATRCKCCNKFLPPNITARRRFCDDKCRVTYHRTASAQKNYAAAIAPISRLGKAQHSTDKQLSIETLKILRKAIDDQLRVLGDVDTQDKYEMLGGNSPNKIYCKACGRQRFDVPKRGEKCDFCGQVNWNYDSWQHFLDNKDPITYD